MDPHIHHHAGYSLIILVLGCSIFIFLYLCAARHQQKAAKGWSSRRSFCFAIGILLIGLALSPWIAHQVHHNFRAHMMQHLLIGMFAPIALVMSAPITLLLRSISVNSARQLARCFSARPFYWLTHPATTLFFNIGGMYALYLTPLYALSLDNKFVHFFVHWHFLAAGYLFVWSLMGPDPLPHRTGAGFRTLILFISVAAHSLLTKLIYALHLPIDMGYEVEVIEDAAKIMFYGGDIAELVLAVIFFGLVFRERKVIR